MADGKLEWLAITRPSARASIDRRKVWTLLSNRSAFIANWYVTEDHWREDGASVWTHENIESDEAREVALAVPELSAADTGVGTAKAAKVLDDMSIAAGASGADSARNNAKRSPTSTRSE